MLHLYTKKAFQKRKAFLVYITHCLLDVKNRVAFAGNRLRQNRIVDICCQRNDRGTGCVTDDSLFNAGNRFQRFLDGGLAVRAHHALDFDGFLHG